MAATGKSAIAAMETSLSLPSRDDSPLLGAQLGTFPLPPSAATCKTPPVNSFTKSRRTARSPTLSCKNAAPSKSRSARPLNRTRRSLPTFTTETMSKSWSPSCGNAPTGALGSAPLIAAAPDYYRALQKQNVPACGVGRFLRLTGEAFESFCRMMGRADIRALSTADLATVSRDISDYTEIPHV
ncbi:hypothetical protein [Pseudoramibacter faecis]|uniref:hypothetical protein n=1 Tax=Pseudoramibacter faecis TaxID=3108534 RepID=UPI002E77D42F|nr:hypothetical protein [Pseudoramibacter sp. HA2172]